MYRAIIAGGRDFNDRELLYRHCDTYLAPYAPIGILVVSGCNNGKKINGIWHLGADALGQQYAITRGHPIEPFRAMWSLYGLAAGPIRNHKMGDFAKAGPVGSELIAFWDGKSPGTSDMIEYADSIGLPFRVIHY